MSEATLGRYVIVNQSGQVELRLTSGGAPVSTFASNAQLALLNGNVIQVNLKNGKVVFYKLGSTGNTVSGPYNSL